jgi:hypothetical protein
MGFFKNNFKKKMYAPERERERERESKIGGERVFECLYSS